MSPNSRIQQVLIGYYHQLTLNWKTEHRHFNILNGLVRNIVLEEGHAITFNVHCHVSSSAGKEKGQKRCEKSVHADKSLSLQPESVTVEFSVELEKWQSASEAHLPLLPQSNSDRKQPALSQGKISS